MFVKAYSETVFNDLQTRFRPFHVQTVQKMAQMRMWHKAIAVGAWFAVPSMDMAAESGSVGAPLVGPGEGQARGSLDTENTRRAPTSAW